MSLFYWTLKSNFARSEHLQIKLTMTALDDFGRQHLWLLELF